MQRAPAVLYDLARPPAVKCPPAADVLEVLLRGEVVAAAAGLINAVVDLHAFAYRAPAPPQELARKQSWRQALHDYYAARTAYLDVVDRYLRPAGYSG